MIMFQYHIQFSFAIGSGPPGDVEVHAASPEQACRSIRQSAGGDITITSVKLLEDQSKAARSNPDVDVVDAVDPNEAKHGC